jgi:RteC protein
MFLDLKKDIGLCMTKGLPIEKETEYCFQISNGYCNRVREESFIYKFENPDEEIDFYKNVKPGFIAEVEYYGLVYHALLFRPKDSIDELKNFWIREMNRLEKFIMENTGFYEYYILRSSWNDANYFTREKNEPGRNQTEFFETDKLMRARPDYLAATILTLKRYKEYAAKQLQECMKKL